MKSVRWRICALLFWATTLNYIDRQVLGILAPSLGHTLGWTEIGYGYIVTSFRVLPLPSAAAGCFGAAAGAGALAASAALSPNLGIRGGQVPHRPGVVVPP